MSTAPYPVRQPPAHASRRVRRPRPVVPALGGAVSAETSRRVRRARTTAARIELVLREPRVMEIMRFHAARALRAPRANVDHRRVPLGAEMVPEVVQEAVIDAMGLVERRGYQSGHDIAGALIGCVQGAAERLCELAARARLDDPTDTIDDLQQPMRNGDARLALVDVLLDERHQAARRAEALARLSAADRRVLELADDSRLSAVQRAAAAGLSVRAYWDRVGYLRLGFEAEFERVRSGVYCQQARGLFPRMMRPGQLESVIGEHLAGRVRLHLAHCPTCSLERRRRAVGLKSWVPWPLLGWFEARWANTKEWATRVSGIYTPSPGMTTEKTIAGASGAVGGAAVKIALVAATAPVLFIGSLSVSGNNVPNRETGRPTQTVSAAPTANPPTARAAPAVTRAASTGSSARSASTGSGGLTGAANEFEPGSAPARSGTNGTAAKTSGTSSKSSPAAAEFAP